MKSYMSAPKTALLIILISVLNVDAQNYFLRTSGDRPYGIAFDGKGGMYMVTAPTNGDGTLSLVAPDGGITRLATLHGTFIGPGITVDDSGNALVTTGDKLLKIAPDGTTKIIADGFTRSFDVKLDRNGNIFVADDIKNIVYKITPRGNKEIIYSVGSKGEFALTAICIDHLGKNIYIRDRNQIVKLPLIANANYVRPEVLCDNPEMFYMCMDSSDMLYVSTIKNVVRIDSTGKQESLSKSDLKTSIGLAPGGKGFKEACIYVAVEDGIVEIPILPAREK